MADYSKFEQKFDIKGLDLNSPTDQPSKPDHAQILKNVRRDREGSIVPRPGTTQLSTGAGAGLEWHSIAALLDPVGATTAPPTPTSLLIHGVGSGVVTTALDGTGAVLRLGALSGDPLSFVPFKPDLSLRQWMAIADSTQMWKINTSGATQLLGMGPALHPPYASLALEDPLRSTISNFDTAVGWSMSAGGPPVLVPGGRVSTTLTRYAHAQYPHAAPGGPGMMPWWYTIELANASGIGPGTLLTYGTGGQFHVFEVFRQSEATTVETFSYPVGTTGVCVIVATIELAELRPNCMVEVGGRYFHVAAVIEGPDGRKAFQIYDTVGGVLAGQAVQVRTSLFGKHTGVGTLAGATVTAPGLSAPTMTGQTEYRISLTLPGTNIQAGYAGNRTVDLVNDIQHISIWCSNWDNVQEVKLMVDVNDGSFTKDWYSRTIRQSDLIAIASDSASAFDQRVIDARNERMDRIRALRNDGSMTARPRNSEDGGDDVQARRQTWNEYINIIDPPGSFASQTGSGRDSWSEVFFRMGDFQKFGDDHTKTLQSAQALRIKVIPKDATVSINMAFDAWYITGGYHPDVDEGAGYEYRYRGRNSVTGTRGNWSPPSRTMPRPRRQRVEVSLDSHYDSTADKIDIQRRGGAVNDWRTIATIDGAPPGSLLVFVDQFSDEHAAGVGASVFGVEGNTNAQPFTVIDSPAKGTTTKVAGTIIEGTGFNTLWAQGTEITVNNVPTLIYRVLSTTKMEVYDPVGSSAVGVGWEIPEPKLTNQPLPVIFGDADGWSFALGDARNPGRLYFFNRYTLDSTRSSYYIDIAPGETLQNGCVYNGRPYVFTDTRMFVLSDDPENVWRADPVPVPEGIWARYSLACGDLMYWLGRNGVYASDGGTTVNITKDTLQSLFFKAGLEPDSSTNGVPKVGTYGTVAAADRNRFRLCVAGQYLYFVYLPAGGGNNEVLVLDRWNGQTGEQGWWQDDYFGFDVSYVCALQAQGENSILIGTRESGGARLLKAAGRTDHAPAPTGPTQFDCHVRTFWFHGDDIRTEKLFGDGFTDIDSGSAGAVNIVPKWYFDNDVASVVIGTTITSSGRGAPRLTDFSGGRYARSIALDIFWANTTADVVLHGWGFTVMDRPPLIVGRATDYDMHGYHGPKHVRGLYLHADTQNAIKDVAIDYTNESGAVTTLTLAATHAVKTTKYYPFTSPVIAMALRIRGTDADKWRLYEDDTKFDYEPYPPITTVPTPWTNDGNPGNKRLYGFILEADSESAARGFRVEYDDVTGGFPSIGAEILQTGSPVQSTLHVGRVHYAYRLDTPVLCHQFRLVPSGAIRVFNIKWLYDPWPEYAAFIPDWSEAGYSGPKHVREVTIEADTTDSNGIVQNVSVQVHSENGLQQTLVLNHPGRVTKAYPITTPFVAHQLRLIPLQQLWMFKSDWTFDQYPELNTTVTAWTDLGTTGPKLIQGFVLNADTGNLPVSINLQGDAGAILQTFSATHNGQVEKSYSLTTPVIAHNLRIVPSGNIRIFDVRVFWKPEAPLGHVWHAQEWELGDPYGFCRDIEIEYASTVTLTLKYYVDGVLVHTDNTSLVSTGGDTVFVKRAVDLPAVKGRLASVRIEHAATQFRVRGSGTVVSTKRDPDSPLQSVLVVGAGHGSGAEI